MPAPRLTLAWTCVAFLLAILTASLVPAAEPADLAGTWTWIWNDAAGQRHRHVLEIEGVDSDLAARERFDDEDPVKASSLKREGKNVRLTVVRGDHHADYSGVLVDSNTINGTVLVKQGDQKMEYPWKATRQKAPR